MSIQNSATPTTTPARTPHLAAVPSSPVVTPPVITPWSIEDYAAAGINAEGAEVLRDRFVAPLVAAAGGLVTLEPADVRNYAEGHGITGTSAHGQRGQLTAAAATGYALMMPWFKVDRVLAEAARGTVLAGMSTWQARPAVPVMNGKGKAMKYVLAAGAGAVIGAHPATPSSYATAPTVVFAEGLLKAYAMLTAHLLEDGRPLGVAAHDARLTADDLRLTADEANAGYARQSQTATRLRKLLEIVPDDRRRMIVALVGVGNWHKNPELNAIGLRDADALIYLDGDIRTNHHVHGQAAQMVAMAESRGATRTLLANIEVPGLEKPGADDALARGITQDELDESATEHLPPAPPRPEREGDTRVRDDHGVTEVFSPGDDESPAGWKRLADLAPRIAATRAVLMAGDQDVAANCAPKSDEHTRSGVLEVTWLDDEGERHTGQIEGPEAVIYSARASDWHKQGVKIPSDILRHDDWPLSPEVLKAAKRHRREDTIADAVYGHMGWAPDPTAPTPAFILGDDVLVHPSARSTSAVRSGVVQHLDAAKSFGLSPVVGEDGRLDTEAWLKAVTEMVEVFDSGAWVDRGHAAMALSIAMRPAAPVPSRTAVVLVGAKGSGKSFTARAMASSVGTWTGDQLMGSASDTAAYTEEAVARSILWVGDDLAPTASARATEARQDAAQDTIRSVRNRTRRRGRSSSGGGTRVELDPRATFVLTTENDLPVESAMDRGLVIQCGRGYLAPGAEGRELTDAVEALLDTDIPRQVLTGLVQWTQEHGGSTWPETVRVADRMRATRQAWAASHLQRALGADASVTRAAENLADAVIGLSWLSLACRRLGAADLVERLEDLAIAMRRTHLEAVVGRAAQGGGRGLLATIRTLLATGQAHVTSPTGAAPLGADPGADPEDCAGLVQRLGWRRSEAGPTTPQGPAVGILVSKDGVASVLITELGTVLSAAHRAGMIPAGMTARQAASQLVTEGVAGVGWKPKPKTRTVFRSHGREGVPIALDTLLDLTDAADEDA